MSITGEHSAGQQVWVITIQPGTPLEPVKEGLSRAGLIVNQVLDAIGIVIACASEAQAEAARKIPGVTDVSREVEADIGPPGAEIS